MVLVAAEACLSQKVLHTVVPRAAHAPSLMNSTTTSFERQTLKPAKQGSNDVGMKKEDVGGVQGDLWDCHRNRPGHHVPLCRVTSSTVRQPLRQQEPFDNLYDLLSNLYNRSTTRKLLFQYCLLPPPQPYHSTYVEALHTQFDHRRRPNLLGGYTGE
ncbi:hypothetical protein FS837_011890 [Tulasnella sp. UAMH 9824]|nr:hypothetical protein FS837_011890 [Tulasnella sp. UAMH 9824]